MTTYAFPSISPTRTTWSLLTNTKQFSSPLTGATQSIGRAGERWHVMLEFSNLHNDDRADLLAFIMKLNGAEHRFTVHDHAYVQRGAGGGTPTVDAGGQTGSTLDLLGGPLSQTAWLEPGDWFSFDNELKMVTAQCDTDGAGGATVSFIPKIRVSPSALAAVDIVAPVVGKFVLVQRQLSWTNTPGTSEGNNPTISNFTIEAVEDILPNG